MRPLRYSLPFVFLATAPLGFVLGGAGSFLTLVAAPVAICGLDRALGFEREGETRAGSGYRLLPRFYIILQIAVIAWSAIMIARPATGLLEAVGLTLSVGATAGVFGILAAHEMVHSRSAAEQGLGLALLASVGYMHFRIAHIHGHHVRGATFDDPASARRGESAYAFVVRSVVGQAREAWMFETAGLRRRGEATFGPSNRMLVYIAIEVAIVACVAAFSLRALVFWLVQAALAILLLELFNYIAHYGLQRQRRPSGGFERMAPHHSWNSLRRMNNWSLFNMGRHTDHHRHPSRQYQSLEADRDAPQLPTGYAGSIAYALVPPLWRKIMDPRVDFWMRGTLQANDVVKDQ